MSLLLKAGLVVLIAVQVLPSVFACKRGFYEKVINGFCLENFRLDMDGLDQSLWCSWLDTIGIYEEVTNCTFQVALLSDCFWPNEIVDRFFVHIHKTYFHNCALTGRLLQDPPLSILTPFIGIPVLITLLMTALVVWRSKRTEGVL
ncbi:receptor activity-modifying protein 1-like [Cynoglossus semilaevis]|uniref:Receptor activity-modifying protein 1 n=1 Tax=Cynoglossus semilaevis TaxID=244447 RepID=A0A3P8V9T6_CYNSE|nr:receptor activity-modifying protein 1-like [Cynoglossus semilaevis]XP_008323231.1 receptor activity-modifying protein 1-like [Cynoglossus semilaevis]